MSLVPAANGVDSIVGGFGITSTDIGANRFLLNINLDGPTDVVPNSLGRAIEEPLPAGISEQFINGEDAYVFPSAGLYIITVTLKTGLNPGAVTFANTDYICVQTSNQAEVGFQSSAMLPIYARAADDADVQTTSVTMMVNVPFDEAIWDFVLKIANKSDTMSLSGARAFVSIYPLCA
jgi:hypothetical protein